MKNSFKQGISKFVMRLLIWAGLRRQKVEVKPVVAILHTGWRKDDLASRLLDEFSGFEPVDMSQHSGLIIDDPIKPAPAKIGAEVNTAKWDADDWIKYKKENPSYYDEDGRSYRC